MKSIFSSNWKHENKILFIAILTAFSLITYYNLNSGYSMSSDSERFSRWADDLIKLNFNLFDFFSIDKSALRPHLFFFSVPVVLIAFCKVFFINEWQFVFLLLNLTLVFFSLLIFVKGLLLVKVRPILICFTLSVIVISVDILVWPRFILSDTIYAFLVILTTYCIIKVIINNKFNFIEIILIIFLLLGSRPSSISVISAIIFFILIFKLKIFSEKKNILIFLFGITILSPIVLSIFYSYIDSNLSNIPKIDFLTSMVKAGMIIHDRPDTWVDIPNNFFDVMIIYFLRFVYFFNPYASTFSILHIVLNVFQTILILSSIIIWSFFKTHIKIHDKIFFFILILSLFITAFHSFILIDYDWRYRFPVILPLLMLFPLSMENILKKINLN